LLELKARQVVRDKQGQARIWALYALPARDSTRDNRGSNVPGQPHR